MTTKRTIADSNRDNDIYWSQVHFPEMWKCARCGITKDDPRARRVCCMALDDQQHDWRRK